MGRNKKNKSIPDRWIDYAPIKDVIEVIKVVPFKVPLPFTKFQDNLLMNYKWTPSDVMQHVPNLGLVIDLSFKSPCFYQPLDFLENGVDFKKIACPGHEVPPEELFLQFCDTVDTFHQENPELIVGVHCTHGVNRTGYMVCRYMVERHNFRAEEALRIFAESRGYQVERDNYIQKIHYVEKR